MKRILTICLLLMSLALRLSAQTIVTNEGAWCWFADPRALHHGQYSYIGMVT